jgi:hypothetical protein
MTGMGSKTSVSSGPIVVRMVGMAVALGLPAETVTAGDFLASRWIELLEERLRGRVGETK